MQSLQNPPLCSSTLLGAFQTAQTYTSRNKITHIELMLSKEHDFDQNQNYGPKSLLTSFLLFARYFSDQLKVIREITELPHIACKRSQFVTNIEGFNYFFISSTTFRCCS
jgi:hypothetical protein